MNRSLPVLGRPTSSSQADRWACMSLADSFCGAIFPPHDKQTGRSSRAGFSQRAHGLHRLTRVQCTIIDFTWGAHTEYCVIKWGKLKENGFRVIFFKCNYRAKTHTNHSLKSSPHSAAIALAERMTLCSIWGTIEPLSKIQCSKKELGHAVWKAFSERGKMAFKNA